LSPNNSEKSQKRVREVIEEEINEDIREVIREVIEEKGDVSPQFINPKNLQMQSLLLQVLQA
jgi:hypothetical protein